MESPEIRVKDTLTEPVRSAVSSILEQMGESHSHEPHWHLALTR
jgi:hypothetical protein